MGIRLLLLLASILTGLGCARVQVEPVRGVAASGRAYVETLKKVNEHALDESLAFSAHVLTLGDRTAPVLQATTDAMRKRIEDTAAAHAYFDAIGDYFEGLEALAQGDPGEATSKALEKTVDALNKDPVGLKLSDPKKAALSGFAGFVARQAHAAAVEKALRRDAEPVARHLALCEQQLDEEIRWVEGRISADRARTWKQKVEDPFLAGEKEGKALGKAWEDAWVEGVKAAPLVALLTQARKASRDMQTSWKKLLQGASDFEALQASLKTVKEGLDALKALKDAR